MPNGTISINPISIPLAFHTVQDIVTATTVLQGAKFCEDGKAASNTHRRYIESPVYCFVTIGLCNVPEDVKDTTSVLLHDQAAVTDAHCPAQFALPAYPHQACPPYLSPHPIPGCSVAQSSAQPGVQLQQGAGPGRSG